MAAMRVAQGVGAGEWGSRRRIDRTIRRYVNWDPARLIAES